MGKDLPGGRAGADCDLRIFIMEMDIYITFFLEIEYVIIGLNQVFGRSVS